MPVAGDNVRAGFNKLLNLPRYGLAAGRDALGLQIGENIRGSRDGPRPFPDPNNAVCT